MLTILKKLLSSIISLILLIAITTLCSIYAARNLLSTDNLLELLNNTIVDNVDYSSLIPNYENNELYKNIEEYIDTKEISEELSTLITDYFKYSSGVPGSIPPSTEELKEIINKSSSKYEEVTGNKLDIEEINKQLDEVESKLKETNEITQNNAYKTAFQFIYNDNYIYTAIVVIVICIVLILCLNEFESLIKHLITISLFNAIGNFGFGIALNKILNIETNTKVNVLVENLTNIFNKIAIISFIVGCLLIIIYIILKVIRNIKNKAKEQAEPNSYEQNNTT